MFINVSVLQHQQKTFPIHMVLIINFQSQSRLPRSGASEQELEKKIDAIGRY